MDGDMNDILQKFNNILEDKDMSNNLKNILNNFSSSNSSNNSSESTNTANINTDYNNDSSEKKSNNGIPEFDINTILKIKKIRRISKIALTRSHPFAIITKSRVSDNK